MLCSKAVIRPPRSWPQNCESGNCYCLVLVQFTNDSTKIYRILYALVNFKKYILLVALQKMGPLKVGLLHFKSSMPSPALSTHTVLHVSNTAIYCYPYILYRLIHKTSKYVQHRGTTCVKCLFLLTVIDANIEN